MSQIALKCGIFMAPYNPPSRTARQVFDWALDIARIADEAGYVDYMIGEHYTLARENIPMPEAIIAAAAQTTKRIRFAPMGHLLPYHNPGTLAARIGWLSQVMEGRYFLGIAPGGNPTDAILHGIDDATQLPPMQIEAMHLMERIWQGEAFLEKGQYFQAGFPGGDSMPDYPIDLSDNRPYGGRESLEIAVTGVSQSSRSMHFAGLRNYSPISFFGGTPQMQAHWDTWAEAMEQAGHVPSRSRYRVCRDVFVADTDKEARRLVRKTGMMRTWREYLKDIYARFGLFTGIIADSGLAIAPDDVDEDFLIDHVMLCGSPETVVEKLEALADKGGGWGQIVAVQHDSIDDPKPWEESLRRFAAEVCPQVRMPG